MTIKEAVRVVAALPRHRVQRLLKGRECEVDAGLTRACEWRLQEPVAFDDICEVIGVPMPDRAASNAKERVLPYFRDWAQPDLVQQDTGLSRHMVLHYLSELKHSAGYRVERRKTPFGMEWRVVVPEQAAA